MAMLNIFTAFGWVLIVGQCVCHGSRLEMKLPVYLLGKLKVNCSGSPKTNEKITRYVVRKLPLSYPSDNMLTVLIDDGANFEFGEQSNNKHPSLKFGYNNSVAIILPNAQCHDRGSYRCEITYTDGDNFRTETLEENLTLHVLPSPPKIEITSEFDEPIEISHVLAEGTINFKAKCRANVGYPWKGRIVWKIYYMCVPELVEENDPRVFEKEDVSTLPPQEKKDECTVRLEHTLKVHLRIDEYYVKVACFILPDSKSKIPVNCVNSTQELCDESETIYILRPDNIGYPIRQSTVEEVASSSMSIFLIVIACMGLFLGILIGVFCNSTVHLKKLTNKPKQTMQNADFDLEGMEPD